MPGARIGHASCWSLLRSQRGCGLSLHRSPPSNMILRTQWRCRRAWRSTLSSTLRAASFAMTSIASSGLDQTCEPDRAEHRFTARYRHVCLKKSELAFWRTRFGRPTGPISGPSPCRFWRLRQSQAASDPQKVRDASRHRSAIGHHCHGHAGFRKSDRCLIKRSMT
jgi:hypothetical protein